MLNKFLLAAVLSAAAAAPALAQTSASPPTSNATTMGPSDSGNQMSGSDSSSTGSGSGSNSSSNSNGMTIRQHLKQDLTKDGFSDVDVEPSSFFVRAKDKGGHRVMMMIGPDSITTITGSGMKASKNGAAANKSAGSDSSSNSSQ